jgi:predicted Zn-dependent protease with MMP-like domain
MANRPKTWSQPPTLEDFEALAEWALGSLPGKFRRNIGDVIVRIEEFPDEETEREMELDSPFDLMGLYRGVSIDHQGVGDLPREPAMVFLYRRPLLDYWAESGEDLPHLVRHVMIHEIGHHFGLSDADMEAIEEAAAE